MLKEMTEHGILWRCLDCQYTTKFKPALFQHVESKHTISSGYNCEFCGKFCPSKNALRCHISRQHTCKQQFIFYATFSCCGVEDGQAPNRPWCVVELCGLWLPNKVKPVMFEHCESKHIESADYNCQHCNKFCRTRNALRSHVTRQHPEFNSKRSVAFE